MATVRPPASIILQQQHKDQMRTASHGEAQCTPVTASGLDDAMAFRPDLAGADAPHRSASAATPALDTYDPSLEILLCAGRVLSQPWRRIWEKNPLIFHDEQFVRFLAPQDELHDITTHITAILDKHPGSVAYFRLDTTKWTGRQTQLWKWVQKLSQKNAQEVIIVNQGYGSDLEFPLEELQSDCLKRLRLGFFSLSQLDLYCFEYRSLDTLDLTGCAFETSKLYHMVKDCRSLTHLGLGLSVKNVKIYSESLEYLQIWRSTMRNVMVECGPKLQTIILGVSPPLNENSVLVTVRDTPVLQEVCYFLLPIYKFEDCSWLKTLKKVAFGIEMAKCTQRTLMCELLQCACCLQELRIWRMDNIGPSEDLDVAVDDSLLSLGSAVTCIRTLSTFKIEDFRGGGAEIDVARVVLKSAEYLRKLSVCPCLNSSEDIIRKAFSKLRRMERASGKCSITFLENSS